MLELLGVEGEARTWDQKAEGGHHYSSMGHAQYSSTAKTRIVKVKVKLQRLMAGGPSCCSFALQCLAPPPRAGRCFPPASKHRQAASCTPQHRSTLDDTNTTPDSDKPFDNRQPASTPEYTT